MTRRVTNQSPQEPRQGSRGHPTSPQEPNAQPGATRQAEPGTLGYCSACGTFIPSTNTTGVCVSCTYLRESVETKLARWGCQRQRDAIIEGQRRTQAAWGITPAMLRAASRVIELGEED